MAYEIGGAGLAGFPKFLAAVRASKWTQAAAEIKDSLLFSQVPEREQENIIIMATGQWPSGISSAEELVKHHEGLTLMPKPDAKGKWEVGWGHDITAPTGAVAEISQAQANTWFQVDFQLAQDRAMADLGVEYWGEETGV